MTAPATYHIGPLYRNDTYGGVHFSFTNIVIDGLRADLWISDSYNRKVLKKLSTTDNTLVIEQSTVKVQPVLIDIIPGTHKYDLQLTDLEGKKTTYVGGRFTVLDDVTKQ